MAHIIPREAAATATHFNTLQHTATHIIPREAAATALHSTHLTALARVHEPCQAARYPQQKRARKSSGTRESVVTRSAHFSDREREKVCAPQCTRESAVALPRLSAFLQWPLRRSACKRASAETGTGRVLIRRVVRHTATHCNTLQHTSTHCTTCIIRRVVRHSLQTWNTAISMR